MAQSTINNSKRPLLPRAVHHRFAMDTSPSPSEHPFTLIASTICVCVLVDAASNEEQHNGNQQCIDGTNCPTFFSVFSHFVLAHSQPTKQQQQMYTNKATT